MALSVVTGRATFYPVLVITRSFYLPATRFVSDATAKPPPGLFLPLFKYGSQGSVCRGATGQCLIDAVTGKVGRGTNLPVMGDAEGAERAQSSTKTPPSQTEDRALFGTDELGMEVAHRHHSAPLAFEPDEKAIATFAKDLIAALFRTDCRTALLLNLAGNLNGQPAAKFISERTKMDPIHARHVGASQDLYEREEHSSRTGGRTDQHSGKVGEQQSIVVHARQ